MLQGALLDLAKMDASAGMERQADIGKIDAGSSLGHSQPEAN